MENKDMCACMLQQIAFATKKYREENDLTNKEMADKVGLATSMISRIEGGKKNISIKTAAKILEFMGYTSFNLPEPEKGYAFRKKRSK